MRAEQKSRGSLGIWRTLTLTVAVTIGLGTGAVKSETLADALAGAYQNSGLLDQNRALLRAADEDVAIAAAALKPIVDYTASITQDFGETRNILGTNDIDTSQFDASLVASLLLYDGGQSRLNREAAKETVLSARQSLISIEQDVLIRAVTAYMQVYAFRDSVSLRENSLNLLLEEQRAAEDRFEVGEVTRTDVAQAEASVAQARSDLATSQGDLQAAIEEYVNVVGRQPGPLAPPPNLPSLDQNVEAARARALRDHPDIQSAQHAVAASELNILRAEATLNPRIDGFTSLGVTEDLGSSNYTNLGRIGVQLSGPIYQGGALDAGIRRAIALRDADLGSLFEIQKRISQEVGTAYASLSARRASLAASEERIRAADIAFRGVREEATLGARTTLDVLDAEQDLLDAQTARLADEANLYVAAYAVLQSTGRLTAQNLNLGVPIYDPAAYYNLVKDAPTNRSEQGQQLDRVLKSLQRN